MQKIMTLSEIEAIDKEFLSPSEVAEYLHKKPQGVRVSMRKGVPWGYVMEEATFIIPKQAFVNYHKYGAVIQIN